MLTLLKSFVQLVVFKKENLLLTGLTGLPLTFLASLVLEHFAPSDATA